MAKYKLKPEFKTAWIAALRSDEYKKATQALRKNKQHFCCLGVACDVAHKMGLVETNWNFNHGLWRFGRALQLPPDVVAHAMFQEFSLDNGHPSSVELYTVGENPLQTLYALNDEGATFAEIADIIEKEF
jgi:hypothetical protein